MNFHGYVSPFKTARRDSNPKFFPRRLFKRTMVPELPATPYMRFSKVNMDKMKEYYPEGRDWNLGRIMGRIWRELPDREKDPFFEYYNADKAEYDRKVKAHYSSLHRANIAGSFDSIDQDQPSSDYNYLLMTNEDPLIDPAEDENDFTINWDTDKQKAKARYFRNNCLMNVIFSEIKMPQIEIQTVEHLNERLESLKKSSNTLDTYLKRLKLEVQNIETVNEQKMNSIHQANIKFHEKLKEINSSKSGQIGIQSVNTTSIYCLDTNKVCVGYQP
ncbi:hypothetical protein O3M35_008018 [Rhynocoris fuscipes]|uniref:HMG box domain-containing protein n=1 Tax=Rhynocoris fuscipes TaxID=488301 RepID=A0AAW1D754_9HEMI